MNIIEDTRQKKDKHTLKNEWWADNGVSVVRCRLPFGDYCLTPPISIDTKASMSEIAQNICGATKEHIRFREECKRAKESGCKLYFLIENNDGITNIEHVKEWVNPRTEYYPNSVQGDRLYKAMSTMEERYGCRFMFCDPVHSAELILKILTGEFENGKK